MYRIIIISILVFTFGCKDDTQLIRLKNELNFENDLTQQFHLAPDSIISITGKKGTKITFKIEDLEGILNGPNIKDSIYINLIELTSKQDLLMANAQTKSDNKWLISGGAFKIEIYSNGEALKLKSGKNISITFPKTSDVNNMQLFYGKRDENNFMDWKESNINLEERKYFSIYYTLASRMDTESARRFGIDIYEDYFIADILGFKTLNEYKLKYPKEDSLYIENDTLSNLKSWKNYDHLARNTYNSKLYDTYYNTIETSKLGWVNIDKFAPELPKATLKFDYPDNFDAIQTYIADEKDNTILNVYTNEVEIPINRSFYIISFAIKDETFYIYKKSVRVSKNSTQSIQLKKINKSQLKSVFELK
ncbi:hypothetical protein [Mariniflexile sp. HMF6888]|uniref:hypothetical protein n=1 Tax=Mariniflexile sp. HMF6888 TaxID=3373086 RepID=UPI0037A49818